MERRSLTVEVDFEKRLLATLIMSNDILKECIGMANPDMLTAGPCRTVGKWCWEYFEKMGEAPQRNIEDLYRAKVMDLNETEAQAIRLFLDAISESYIEPNPKLMVKEATHFFKLQALIKLKEGLDRAILLHDTDMGENMVAEYVAPERILRSSISLFNCAPGRIARAFNNEAQDLFTFPGEAARKVMGSFSRTDFIAFAAPPKRGKSWWLMKLAATAAKAGLNVLYISLEMYEDQVIRRFWQQYTGSSRWGEDAVNPRFEASPTGRYTISAPTVSTPRVDTDLRAIAEIQERLRNTFDGRLEIRCWPTYTMTVPMLERELKDMAVYENFTPDVIVIDYADIMTVANSRLNERDRLNEIWASLRGLAQKREVLVATASQTGRSTVNGHRDADDADLSEDIRKLAHVTKLLVINQTLEERAQGIYRISNNTTRDEAAAITQLVCTSMLAIGEPMMDCRLLSECDLGGNTRARAEEGDDGEPPRRRGGKFKI